VSQVPGQKIERYGDGEVDTNGKTKTFPAPQQHLTATRMVVFAWNYFKCDVSILPIFTATEPQRAQRRTEKITSL
jgi:hypothetical protein